MEIGKVFVTEAGLDGVVDDCRGQHLCGYVRVPEEHSFYGVDSSIGLPSMREEWERVKQGDIGKRGLIPLFCCGDHPRIDVLINVHGGVTYSGKLRDHNGWWLGFDCGHYGDNSLKCNLAYVVSEIESLARQIVRLDRKISVLDINSLLTKNPKRKDAGVPELKKLIKAHRIKFVIGEANFNNFTAAYNIVDDENFSFVLLQIGFTICSYKERYSKNRGKTIAAIRLLGSLGKVDHVPPDGCFIKVSVSREHMTHTKALVEELVDLHITKLAFCGHTFVPRIYRKQMRNVLRGRE